MGAQLVAVGDVAVAVLAHGQHGVVSVEQLRAAGLERRAVAWRVRHGRLHRVHRGVYAVGHARLGLRGRWWAAILACGGPDRAVLSHRAAAAHHDLLAPPAGAVDVLTLRRSASTPAVRVHRSSTLTLADVVRDPDGLAVTTVARTLVDLVGVLTPHALTRTVHRAEHLRLLDTGALTHARSRSLRAALASLARAEPVITRSELEERLLALVAGHELPPPVTNARVVGHEVDFHWPRAKLVVETDGAATHLTRSAFEHDRARDAALQASGWRVVRFTWRQVTQQPGSVARTLAALLAR